MLQCVLVLCLLASSTGNVVYYGPVPKEYIRTNKSQRVEPVRLTRDGPDFLLVESDTSLAVFAVADTKLKRVGVIPLPALPQYWDVARRWLERDMDGDSLPEFVAANGNKLREFKWQDSAFALASVAALPDSSVWIEDFVLGDVNRDGLDEVILVAGDHKPGSADEPQVSSALYVTRWSTDSLRVLWTDRGRLGLHCASDVVPPNDLIGVYDVRNTGRLELLYENVESSLAPFSYDCFEWRDAALVLSRGIRVQDWRFADSVPESERFRSAVSMRPSIEDGRTKLYVTGDSYDAAKGRRSWTRVVELHGDTVVSVRTIAAYASADDYEEARCELDPDGKGRGVLRLVSNSVGGLWYEFRR